MTHHDNDNDRWVDQTILHTEDGPPGNCVQASVASLLGVTLNEVPHFVELYYHRWMMPFRQWLRGRGLELHRMERTYHPSGYYLALGPSQRGVSHMVVMKDGDLAHDPHPSRRGLLSVEQVWMIAPSDVGSWRQAA